MLLDHGHTDVRRYPIGRLWEETTLVVERLNQDSITQATLMDAAYGASQSKKGRQHFNKMIKRLTNGV